MQTHRRLSKRNRWNRHTESCWKKPKWATYALMYTTCVYVCVRVFLPMHIHKSKHAAKSNSWGNTKGHCAHTHTHIHRGRPPVSPQMPGQLKQTGIKLAESLQKEPRNKPCSSYSQSHKNSESQSPVHLRQANVCSATSVTPDSCWYWSVLLP